MPKKEKDMNMDESEEKFFEQLANLGSEDGEDNTGENVGIELAKASTVPAARLKTPARKAAEEKTEVEEEYEGPEGQLTVDVYQTQSEIVVESAIAGVKPDDLDVTVSNDSIAIRGKRRREYEIKEEDYFYQECYWGRFARSIILPQEVDPDGAVVNFKNGILTVRLPKLSRQKTKKLKIKID